MCIFQPVSLRSRARRLLALTGGTCALAFGVAGCVTPPPAVTPQMLGYAPPGKTVEDLEEGRRVYLFSCSKCHALDAPERFSVEAWRRIVPEMAESAKISPRAERMLLDYLLSARGQQLEAKGKARVASP